MKNLVLIPGMMCDARLFGPQIDAFSKDWNLLLPQIHQHDSIEKLAQTVLDAAPNRFAVAGLSMGGIVAMEMLRQAPERVDRIALLDTNARAESETVKSQRLPQMQAAQDGQLTRVMRDEMKPKYLAGGPQGPRILDLCMEMALALGPQVFLQQSRALMDRPDQSDVLRNAICPSLIMCGRHDALCSIATHEYMAQLMSHSVFEIIEDAGHLPTLEQPEKTNAVLRRWLES